MYLFYIELNIYKCTHIILNTIVLVIIITQPHNFAGGIKQRGKPSGVRGPGFEISALQR